MVFQNFTVKLISDHASESATCHYFSACFIIPYLDYSLLGNLSIRGFITSRLGITPFMTYICSVGLQLVYLSLTLLDVATLQDHMILGDVITNPLSSG